MGAEVPACGWDWWWVERRVFGWVFGMCVCVCTWASEIKKERDKLSDRSRKDTNACACVLGSAPRIQVPRPPNEKRHVQRRNQINPPHLPFPLPEHKTVIGIAMHRSSVASVSKVSPSALALQSPLAAMLLLALLCCRTELALVDPVLIRSKSRGFYLVVFSLQGTANRQDASSMYIIGRRPATSSSRFSATVPNRRITSITCFHSCTESGDDDHRYRSTPPGCTGTDTLARQASRPLIVSRAPVLSTR